MRKLLICLFIGIQAAQAQNIGFNGAGFFENYNAEVEQYLIDLHTPFTMRFPGGSISKFHDPYNVRKGWGMTAESVTNWFESTGFDEDGNGLDKWLHKAEEQPDHSYMDDLIALQKKFPDMTVLWVLNILNSTPEANMQAVRYLMQGGVRIVGVEAGNEVYGKYASFSEYIKDFEPIFNLIRSEYPQIKLGLVVGVNTSRKDITNWNNDMSKYKGDYDAIIPHFYYTQRELGEAYDMIPLRTDYSPKKENKDLTKAFTKAAELLDKNDLIGNGIKYFNNLFPGKAIWVTEWNTKPSEMIGNTIVNGAWQFEQMIKYRNQTEYLLMHNGVGPDKHCAISKVSKFDLATADMLRRVGYYAFLFAAEVGNSPELPATAIQKPTAPTTYWFTNLAACKDVSALLVNCKEAQITIHYLGGKYLYSSAGFAGYMGKGSEKSFDIEGVNTDTFTGMLPANAFGYIEIIPKR